MRRILAILSVFTFVATLDSAYANPQSCVKSFCFAASTTVGDQELPLRGTALFTYWGFKVYAAAFYAAESVDTQEEALGPVTKKLVLQYFRTITKGDFAESSEKTLAKDPNVDRNKIRTELDELYDLYQDVKEEDRYSLEYASGKGTTLKLNDVAKGTIEGDEFPKAYFGIWLGPYGLDDDNAKKLVGQKAD